MAKIIFTKIIDFLSVSWYTNLARNWRSTDNCEGTGKILAERLGSLSQRLPIFIFFLKGAHYERMEKL